MSVWYAIPSKKQPSDANRCLAAWSSRGYRVAVWRDPDDDDVDASLIVRGGYAGYANAVNALCREIRQFDPNAAWIVTGGDDVLPDVSADPTTIAAECTAHFGGTFGVMQPTGDRWGQEHKSAYIDRVAGSPWMGREFTERMYGGNGPLWHGWRHMFVDEELQHVAQRLNCFWQRRDLTHTHEHWARNGGKMPAYLARANAEFAADAQTFRRRQAAGFPGHQPIHV